MDDREQRRGTASARSFEVGVAQPPTEQTLPAAFAVQARRRAGSVAVVTESGSCTYDELDRRSNQVGNCLAALGPVRGATVGVFLEQGIDQIAAILGVLKAGGIYVPLDSGLARPRLREIVGDSDPRLILADGINEALASLVAAGRRRVLRVPDQVERYPESPPAGYGSPADYAYVYYTSGTTGAPKGVVDNHRNVLHNVARYTASLGVRCEDRLTLLQSCGFSGAVSNIFTALLNGATLLPFDVRARGAAALAAWLALQEATIYHSVPSLFRQVASAGVPLPSLRIVRLEGDAARAIDVAAFDRHFDARCTLVNGLGATETGIAAQYFMKHGQPLHGAVVPVGRATADVSIDLLDEEGRPVPPGAIGEIVVKSRYLACGYWRRSELTEARFSLVDGDTRAYRTRDLGRLDPDGMLEVHGRADLLAKVRGEWVDLAALERGLAGCPGVDDAIAMVQRGSAGDSALTAWVLARREEDASPERLREALRGRGLPESAMPSRIVRVARWPTDRNGKVDRGALVDLLESPTRRDPPATPTERLIADVFERTLGIGPVSAGDDFFALGGDSLRAVEACLELGRRTGSDVALSAFQHASTVAGLARVIDGAAEPGSLVPLQPFGAEPALFCVHAHMGHVFNLRELALQFAPDRRFVGLQARGLDGREPPETSVAAMADSYVARLREAQPDGPYLIAGHCFGSWVALEMARRLRADGQCVAALLLIDPGLPPGYQPARARGADPLAMRLRRMTLPEAAHALRSRLGHGLRPLRSRLRWMAARWLSPASGLRRRLLRRPADAIQAMSVDYRPAPYEGAAIVLAAKDRPPDMELLRAWQACVRGGVEVDRLAGRAANLLSQPYVRDLAARLLGHIERALPVRRSWPESLTRAREDVRSGGLSAG